MNYKIFDFREYCKNRCQNEKKCVKECEKLLIDFFKNIDEKHNQELIFRILRS
jgi:hypothetical protein